MDRKSVDSTNIRSIGHDPDSNILEIEFKDGGVYHYHGVDGDAFDAMMNAASKGKHFHAHIRGSYRAEKK